MITKQYCTMLHVKWGNIVNERQNEVLIVFVIPVKKHLGDSSLACSSFLKNKFMIEIVVVKQTPSRFESEEVSVFQQEVLVQVLGDQVAANAFWQLRQQELVIF